MTENNALTVQNNNNLSLDSIMKFADVFVRSKRFATESDVFQAAVKIQAGKELGLQPVESMNNIVIVNGRITLGAALVGSLIKKSKRYWYRVIEHTNESCSIEFSELFDGKWQTCGISAFTIEDAKTAGLNSKDVWKKFPRNMLLSRAITNGARWYCPDVFGGPIYSPDELDDNLVDSSVLDGDYIPKPSITDMTWKDFVGFIGIDEDELKRLLKDGGFTSWSTTNKQAIYEFVSKAIADKAADDNSVLEAEVV